MSETTPAPEASTSSPPLTPAPAEDAAVPDAGPSTTAAGSDPLSPAPETAAPAPTAPSNPVLLPSSRAKPRTKSSSAAAGAGTNGRGRGKSASAPLADGLIADEDTDPLPLMGITESIASAPNPRPTDFSYDPNVAAEQDIDIDAALAKAEVEDMPGSPTSRIMRNIAPPQASQPDVKWPAPPQNASVNLFIGRALLANGNDNWPLKPNDIVNWIRKHYPSEWDGDEGRCSAHRVRTYLARKGTDMYYEKLAQATLSGWRIRQGHLWRFENGGFQGRGMKQEEALAEKQKEHQAAVTDRHKAAALEALAAGHPGVKTSMSLPGTSDGQPAAKKIRIKGTGQAAGQARRRNMKKEEVDNILAGLHQQEALAQQQRQEAAAAAAAVQAHAQTMASPLVDAYYPDTYGSQTPSAMAGPSSSTPIHAQAEHIDPLLSSQPADTNTDADVGVDPSEMDINLVHQAMQAAAGHIDDLDMGIQLPIEMQLHGDGEHEHEHEVADPGSAGQYYGQAFASPHHQPYGIPMGGMGGMVGGMQQMQQMANMSGMGLGNMNGQAQGQGQQGQAYWGHQGPYGYQSGQ